MENQLQEKVKQSIKILREKQARIYFLVQDTKGNAKASVKLIYQMAKSLKDNGFNPIWNEDFKFVVNCLELAFVKFTVLYDLQSY